MAADQRRKKHHFLARHLLSHFVRADGLLTVYDRRQGWSDRRDIPERVAVENYLYAPETALGESGDPKDDTVERWLADEIDGPAAEPIASLAAGASLSDLSSTALHAIADFLALLDLRTPAVRDLLVPAFIGAARSEMANDKDTQKRLRKRGVYVTRGDVRRGRHGKGEEIASGLAKPAWLSYLQETRALARLNVKERRWSLIDADPPLEFVTSDLGIAKSLVGPTEPASWEPGTWLGRAHWIIPICPSRAIAITPAPFPHDPTPSRELVERTNHQLVRDSRRYVYSRSAIPSEVFLVAPEDAGTSGSVPHTV